MTLMLFEEKPSCLIYLLEGEQMMGSPANDINVFCTFNTVQYCY